MRSDLPRLTVGDAFDEAFDLYKRNFGLFVLSVALLYIPADAMLAGAVLSMQADQLAGPRQPTPADVERMFGILALLILALAGFYMLLSAMSGAITIAASERYLGRPITVGQTYRAMFRALPRLLAGWLIVGLMIAVAGFVLLLILTFTVGIALAALGTTGAQNQWIGTAVGVAYVIGMAILGAAIFVWMGAFVTPVIMIEGAGPFAAIQRNMELVRGRAMRLVLSFIGLVVVVVTIQNVLMVCVQLGLGWLVMPWIEISDSGERILEAVLGGIISLFVQPLWMTLFTVLYYDQRVRKEGFDIALMLAHLDNRRREAALAEAREMAP